MRVHRDLDALSQIPRPVVTMGSFDGVHAGHRAIIRRIKLLADLACGSSVMVTFHPHPRKVLYPDGEGRDLKLISTMEERCILLEDAGLDHLIIMEFSPQFSRMSPEDYVKDILLDSLNAHTIVVGFNHYFGYNKKGDFRALSDMSRKYGFKVEEIPEQEIRHETVSSTRIRRALGEGHIQRANACLEHQFLILATLRAESGCFRCVIGDPDKLVPPDGAYAASYRIRDGFQKSLVRIVGRGLYLYPLHDQNITGGERVSLLFQKRLTYSTKEDPERYLDEIKELIY